MVSTHHRHSCAICWVLFYENRSTQDIPDWLTYSTELPTTTIFFIGTPEPIRTGHNNQTSPLGFCGDVTIRSRLLYKREWTTVRAYLHKPLRVGSERKRWEGVWSCQVAERYDLSYRGWKKNPSYIISGKMWKIKKGSDGQEREKLSLCRDGDLNIKMNGRHKKKKEERWFVLSEAAKTIGLLGKQEGQKPKTGALI